MEPPGIWLTYKPQNSPPLDVDTTSPGGPYYKHRVGWTLGARVATELVGLRETKVTGVGVNAVTETTYGDPGVTIADPTDPAYVTGSMDKTEALLYKRCYQGHLANTSTAEASGVAYQQARAQHEADLNGIRGAVEGLIRDTLEAVIAYAALMNTEAADLLVRFRVVVTLHVQAGPVTREDAEMAANLRDNRLISQAAAQARVGVEDPVAMQAEIDADPLTRAEFWTKIVTAMNELLNAENMTHEGAAWLLGLSAEQLEVFRTGRPPVGEADTKPALVA